MKHAEAKKRDEGRRGKGRQAAGLYQKVSCQMDLSYQTGRHPQCEFSFVSENISTCRKCSSPFACFFLSFKISVILKNHLRYPWYSVRDKHSKGKLLPFLRETVEIFLQGAVQGDHDCRGEFLWLTDQ